MSRAFRRFVIENQQWLLGTLTFGLRHQLAQLFRVVYNSTGMRMFGFPFAQVVEEAVGVVTGLARQIIFDPPKLFKNWTRFHINITNSPSGARLGAERPNTGS